jgi:acyl-CoA thioester hydrolase
MKPPAVDAARVTALAPPSLRVVVPDNWADDNGHMNMRWYVAVFDDAGDDLHARIGLTPEFHRRRHTGTVDLEHHTHFLKEVMPGDSVAVYTRLVARSAKRLHYLMFLINETKGNLAAIFECMNAFLDLQVRKTSPFPPEVSSRIDAWLAKDTDLDWSPPVSGAMHA